MDVFRISVTFFAVLLFSLQSVFASCIYGINTDFFSDFNDEYLKKYIFEALDNNHTFKEANFRVEQYRNEIKTQISKELPTLSVGANYLGTHFPKGDINIFEKDNAFIVPIQANWEPDLLFKNIDKIKSKKYLYKANVARQKGIYISLLTDIANAYLNILLYDYLIEKQKEIVKDKEENTDFNKNKYTYGIVSLINLNDIFAEFYSQKIVLNNLIKVRNNTIHNFITLLGRSAFESDIYDFERGTLENFEYQKNIPAKIDYELINFRPDLMELENLLKSAKIDITVAKKEFFPNFSITALMFFDTAGQGNFFAWNSSFAALIAGVTQDIFKGGEKIANLKIKKARFNELLQSYKQKDLEAIKEICNVLNSIEKDTQNEMSSIAQLELDTKSFIAAKKEINWGLISKVEYLQTKNSMNQKEQLRMYSKAQRLADYFNLYKTLGGAI